MIGLWLSAFATGFVFANRKKTVYAIEATFFFLRYRWYWIMQNQEKAEYATRLTKRTTAMNNEYNRLQDQYRLSRNLNLDQIAYNLHYIREQELEALKVLIATTDCP